ncbi:hypothetical protein DSAG12_03779 [Promethearchaeum syntrophicum]|uniref:Uncharacterized protein n=1 Tax=Promethearchaeum syntrophicum TaxID=2594042 RepID=A0A5B9DFZ9_9ARCH|nr:hypothetical protein [Candidatus Prometheoarchaeum syntrophicum]QEE17941.1 hypothetical protein DSAG12_03779 [Candidatus Prometheoarchaeum syntrophicum]
MTILETAILFKGISLSETYFYSSEDVLNQKDRNVLTEAVIALAKSAFDDKIQNFSIGEHKILIKLKDLKILKATDEENEQKDHLQLIEPQKNPPLVIYCIVEKDTNQKQVNMCMDDAIIQFLNRFSVYDITTKDASKFKKFNKRLKIIFQELALKTEDRFKSIL